MPGVVAALVPDDVVHAVAEQVGRLALALIAPLGANNHDGGHGSRLASVIRAEPDAGPARSDVVHAAARRKRCDQADDSAANAAGLASPRNSLVLAASSTSPIAAAAAPSR